MWSRWSRPALPILVVSALLCLGAANVASRVTWRELEDGVFWTARPEGVVAADIAVGTPAAAVGLARGDLLLAIDDRPIQDVDDVMAAIHSAEPESSLRYTVLRLGSNEVIDVRLAPSPGGAGVLYFVLAAVGTFTLLVGGVVRLRRPRDPATLHFLWLTVAFFGVFTFSFSGRLDRLDWAFYWADVVSILVLPPLFLHFTLVFPERPRRWMGGTGGRAFVVFAYVPAIVLGLARIFAVSRSASDATLFIRITSVLDRIEFLYLAMCFIGGLVALTRALSVVHTITARRQLRWIAWGTALGAGPFALGYALPYSVGVEPSLPMQLSAIPLSLIPLAYASAIVRYRLMDVEVIVKRALVYAAALSAIVAIYVVLLELVQRVVARENDGNEWVIAFLATLVAVLLAPPVKDFVQNVLDRAFYRDRYDYRRALVGFARDLNSDLDLNRVAERLVSRVVETLVVERMALMLEDESESRFEPVRASGFGDDLPPALSKGHGVGERLSNGHMVALDDPLAAGRFAAEEIEFWRDTGLYYFVPCVSKEGTIAVLALGRKNTNEPLSSEDMALLTAVAGQIATTVENARLYRQLHVKAIELDRLRAFNENILESLDDGLLVVDLEDRVVRWNTAIEHVYGVSRAEATGCALEELFDAPFVEVVRAARRDTPSGATLSRIPLHGRGARTGRTLIVNAAVVPLRAADGPEPAVAGTIVIIEDITTRVQLEEQLQISEKMASIGLLAAGVAHEVNTPLTGISSFTQMLLEGADPGDPRTRLLEKIERQTFRAAKIVNGLLNLSRQTSASSNERGLVDLNTVITDVLGLLEHQFELHKIRVRRELSEQPAMVLGMEHKLQQVFLNLFLNAKDAMPKGGWLSVRTHVGDGRASAEVADTGSGIPNEYLARIYDPFFTTKAISQGTGLGLSITYGIVREHEGSIDCDRTCWTRHAVHALVTGCSHRAAGVGNSPLICRGTPQMRRNGSILVIDDEEIMREILEAVLAREGYKVRLASSGEEGIELVRSASFDAVILDVMMPGLDGIATLEELRKLDEELPVLMITAFASVETAISAMKRGAFDYITKPFKNDEVLVVVRNAVERRQLLAENLALRQSLQAQAQKFSGIIGRSSRMRQVFNLIMQAAPSRSTILITGESGTGKELVARAIHANSLRADRAFVTVNSGNLPPDLLESTLFGHVKGAFTGAIYPKKGLCDLADKGSIFFDEIGNISSETQAKLLRVMQEREFMRLGGMETIKVDVRIVAATNCDLRERVEEGRFREDLFYRLHVINIWLPPLRERKDDIPVLAQHFLEKYGTENNKPGMELTVDALDRMMDYDWPGNVRELENVIERAVVLGSGLQIGPDLIPEHVRSAPSFHIPKFVVPPEGISFKDVITNVEKRLIESTLEAAGGVQKKAAELLRIKPTTLNEMIKRYEIGTRRKKLPALEADEARDDGTRLQPFPAAELTRD